MKVIIVGAGSTGTQLAKYMLGEGHIVSIIESDEEKARHTSNRLDCLVIHEEGNNLEALNEAGISDADALICVTESDEDNMIICGLAASLYPSSSNENSKPASIQLPWLKRKSRRLIKIARVRDSDYILKNHAIWQEQKILGIDYFIHPDAEAAKAVLISLSHGAMGNILNFSETPYEMGSITIEKESTFDGLSLSDFHSFIRDECIIPLIERGHDCFLPAGSTVLLAGDLIHVITRKENIEQVFKLAGRTKTPLKRIGIVGAGHLGSLILEGLLTPKTKDKRFSFFGSLIAKRERQITVIEQDYSLCRELASRFPETLVLNEDISDENFIAEEQIGNLDLVITATSNQELNVIAAVYLKSHGVKRAIAVVSGIGYKTIALQLGVDVAISMNSVVADSILSRLEGTGIRDIHSLGDGSVSIIEVEIKEDSPAVEKPITYFKLSAGGVIMLVIRGDSTFIPQGDYIFKSGDKLFLIAKNGSDPEIIKVFGTQKKD